MGISRRLVPRELLSQEDILKLIRFAGHERNKALISCLYESGCRLEK